MADQNLDDAARDIEQAARLVAEDIRRYGFMRSQTEQQHITALEKLEKSTGRTSRAMTDSADKMARAGQAAGNALSDVADAGLATASAMYQGQKGAAAFNRSLDHLEQAATAAGVALTLLVPGGALIKGLVAGLTLLTGGVLKLAKTANEMSDKLYTSFGALNRAGGAAADGMTGLFNDAKNLGLSMNELSALTDAVGSRAQDFALFGGSVADARKRLGQMGDQLRENREQFLSLGMTMPEVTEGLANYVALQSRLGRGQSQTTAQMAESAKKYLMEQDALTKLLGINRQEQEAAQQRAMLNDQFMAKIRELQLAGQHDVVAELMKMSRMYAAFGPESEAAFHGAVTNNLAAQETVKGFIASNGEIVRTTQAVINRQMKGAEAVQRTGQAMGQYLDTVGVFTGQMKTNSDIAVAINEQNRARILTNKNLSEEEKRIQLEQIAMGAENAKAQDPVLAQQAKLRDIQIQANEALEELAFDTVPIVGDYMVDLAKVTRDAAEGLQDMVSSVKEVLGVFGIGEEAPTPERQDGGLTGADTPRDIADRERALEGAMTDEERLGFQRGLAKDAEGVGRALADFVGLVSDDAGRVIDNIVDKAQKSRIESEQKYLQQQGRAPAAVGAAPPAPDAAPGGGGGGTIGGPDPQQGYTERDLRKMGLRIKSGYTHEAGEKIQSNTLELARAAQKLPGFRRITGFNDEYHQGTTSQHAQGAAFDFTLRDRPSRAEGQDIIEKLIGAGASKVLDEYNRPSRRATAGHIHVEAPLMARGGITEGVSIAGEAGPEAVVPLPDGRTIPVEITDVTKSTLAASIDTLNARLAEVSGPIRLNQQDVMAEGGIGGTVGGFNAWKGYNAGGMTTDLEAIKDIAGSLGAFDRATETITNPQTWQKILQSNIATNVNLGAVEVGTKMGGSDIGIDIGERVKEVMATNSTDITEALRQVKNEFNAAMQQVVEGMQQQKDPAIQMQILQVLNSINQNQSRTADASQRMADVAMN